ncbi:MAG: MFS transporter, partial [Acidimicrobiia bacterium]|nr:MFS transporter [Acidimicrobiia bacterium]
MTERFSMSDREGRWVLATTIMGSSIVLLTATSVNVALPSIGRELEATAAGIQWVVTGYFITMASLMLTGGALGDRLGRRRVYLVGVAIFAGASVACAAAPTLGLLVGARFVQGVGGALLTPGSLAIINAAIRPEDRGRAVGLWAGLTGIATAVGPLLGGWLVDAWSWRAIFLLNVPVAVAVFVVAIARLPADLRGDGRRVDVPGAVLATVALATFTFAVVQGPERGWGDGWIVAAILAAVVAATSFVVVEKRGGDPMLPLAVFSRRTFTAANLVTVSVYGPLSAMFFLLNLYLQNALGYSPLESGAAGLPVTALMLVLSPAAGDLAQRIGPRTLLTAGPLVMAASLVWFAGLQPGDAYLVAVAGPVTVFGLGLAATVSPVTSTALAALPSEDSGLASGVNNTVARASQLVAIAAIPPIAGLTGTAFEDVG